MLVIVHQRNIQFLFQSLFYIKASGALISSRLIPPKVGAIPFTISINLSGSFSSISISKTLISAKILNKSPFPSITGFEASAPISPSPSTAVPLEITATGFPFLYNHIQFPVYHEFPYKEPLLPESKPMTNLFEKSVALTGSLQFFPLGSAL